MNACIRGTIATCVFELSRTMNAQRMMAMAVLIGFPAAMLSLINFAARNSGESIAPVFEFLILVLTGLIGILALLLWASTSVYSELEGKSWVYLACRPFGRISTILGKYLAAVILSYFVCLAALTLAIIVAQMNGGLENPKRYFLVVATIFLLACLTYAAIFTFVGTLFYRRAMVFCAAWVLVSECFLFALPAVVRNFTVMDHLWELMIAWQGWLLPLLELDDYRVAYPDQPSWFNLLSIGLFIFLSLAGSCLLVNNREYITADET